jgi:putative heme-binding domain-containing protein
LDTSRDAVIETQRALDDRLANLRLLEFAEFEYRQETLWSLLSFQHPQDRQLSDLLQLLQNRDPVVAAKLIDRWSSLSRACRSLASDALIHRPANHNLLLTALEEERLPLGQLNLDLERRRRLLRSNDPTVRRRAEALFTDAGVVTRTEVLTQLKPALQLLGNPDSGRVHFTNLCAQCHTIASTGHAVGPDLTEIFRKGAGTLLSDLFDPNAAVNTEYLGTTIDNDAGDVFSGIVLAETETFVTLREAGGRDIVIPRDRIEDMTSGGLSLMPEGLEAGLTLQDVADLLAFLQQPK